MEQLSLFNSTRVTACAEYIARVKEFWKEDFDFEKSLVAMFRIGSHSHGTHIPPADPNGIDDEDIMCIVCPPPSRALGMRRYSHSEIKEGTLDCVIYDWGKYLGLLAKSNPNVLGTLWLRPHDVLFSSVPYKHIRNERDRFASKLAYKAFVGYAKSQLHKMEHNAHEGYMGEKRKQLVAKFGYDTKNAAHLIRLIRMCTEFLTTKNLAVYREADADFLRDIKRGKYQLEEVKRMANYLFVEADALFANTTLPERPDEKFIHDVSWGGYLTLWKQFKYI